MAAVTSTEQLNVLIYNYLLESNFPKSASEFSFEAAFHSYSEDVFEKLPPGGLKSILINEPSKLSNVKAESAICSISCRSSSNSGLRRLRRRQQRNSNLSTDEKVQKQRTILPNNNHNNMKSSMISNQQPLRASNTTSNSNVFQPNPTNKQKIIAKIFGNGKATRNHEASSTVLEEVSLVCKIPLSKIPKYQNLLESKSNNAGEHWLKDSLNQNQVSENDVFSNGNQEVVRKLGDIQVASIPNIQQKTQNISDSSIISPTVPARQVYHSYFEKEIYNEESIDGWMAHQYARELKRKGVVAPNTIEMTSLFLESVAFFLLGRKVVREGENYSYCLQVVDLVKHAIRRLEISNQKKSLVKSKLLILSWRCHAVMSFYLFRIKLDEVNRRTLCFDQYLEDKYGIPRPFKDKWVCPETPESFISPSSHEPSTPLSPGMMPDCVSMPPPDGQSDKFVEFADAIGKDRKMFEGFKSHFNRSKVVICMCEVWELADNLVTSEHLEDFFIKIDKIVGPLTFHSTFDQLTRYIRLMLQMMKEALEIPKNDANIM